MQEGDIDIQYVSTDQQVEDTFNKPLGEERYTKLRHELGIVLNPSKDEPLYHFPLYSK